MHAALPSLPTLFAFVGAGLILARTPGPDMALVLTRTLSGGRANGFAALAGVSGGPLAQTLAAATGLRPCWSPGCGRFASEKQTLRRHEPPTTLVGIVDRGDDVAPARR